MNRTVLAFSAFILVVSLISSCKADDYVHRQNAKRDADTLTFPDSFDPYSYHHYHHHEYYNPWDGDDRNTSIHNKPAVEDERGDDSQGQKNLTASSKQMQIPLQFLKEINQFNISDLLLYYVDDYEETSFLQNRFGEEERNAAVMPKKADCIPELTTVKITPTDDPSVLYIPSCTRIERCGGCCAHALLSCQPKDIEAINYQVIKTQYTGAKKLKYVGKEIVTVEKHTKCKCDCKVQPQDCNRFQEYKKSECRCACTNSDEEKKCVKQSSNKLWNPDICACQCREQQQCSSGYYYNSEECKCMPVLIRRRYVQQPSERKGYKSDILPAVLPLVNTKNRD